MVSAGGVATTRWAGRIVISGGSVWKLRNSFAGPQGALLVHRDAAFAGALVDVGSRPRATRGPIRRCRDKARCGGLATCSISSGEASGGLAGVNIPLFALASDNPSDGFPDAYDVWYCPLQRVPTAGPWPAPPGGSPWRARRLLPPCRLLRLRVLLAGDRRTDRPPRPGEAHHRRHRDDARSGAQAAARSRAGNPRVRIARARLARQPQLHELRGPRAAVRGLERVRHAGAFAHAAAVVLSGRRLRRVSRLFRRGRRARRSRTPGRRR